MLVNVASSAGSRHGTRLQAICDEYAAELAVLSFPPTISWARNRYRWEIGQFCELNCRVTFPLFSKIR
jgi:glutathione peroxidase-family protein